MTTSTAGEYWSIYRNSWHSMVACWVCVVLKRDGNDKNLQNPHRHCNLQIKLLIYTTHPVTSVTIQVKLISMKKLPKTTQWNISFGFGFYVNRLNIGLGRAPRIASIHCLYLGPHHVESWKVYHKFPNNLLWLWTVHCVVLPPRQVGGGVFLVIIILWCQRVKTSEV